MDDDQMITDPLSQTSRFSSSFAVPSSASASQQDRGYTIVVPANVCFRGVNMQLDLKIDQKTLAAASDISKAVEEAVSSHFSQTTPSSSSCVVADGGTTTASAPPRRLVRMPSKQPQLSFSISEPDSLNGSSGPARMDCDSSNGLHSTAFLEMGSEQVNEVCSSTVDSSPVCDTASSPVGISPQNSSQGCPSGGFSVSCDDDQRPSSSAVLDNEVHSSVEDVGEGNASTSVVDGVRPLPSPMSVGEASPSSSAPPPKRRRDKTAPPSHFCEQNDPGGKGQCRQRAILSYRYCIRHILLDPNAPYRQCQHKRKPKSKKDTNLFCTNAVRNDKESVYCSTHMIMNGMMEPKKKKSSLPTGDPSTVDGEASASVIGWEEDGIVDDAPSSHTLQPLPSIVHCGFEQSQVTGSEEIDRWMADGNGGGSMGSSVSVASAPSSVAAGPSQQFSCREPSSVPANPSAYPHTTTPVMHRHASSYPPSVQTSSNMSSVSFDEPCSLPANPSQMLEDGPCSSSMVVPPSPSRSMLSASSRPSLPTHFPSSTPMPTSSLTKQHPQLAAKLLQTSGPAPCYPSVAPLLTAQPLPSSVPHPGPSHGIPARAEMMKCAISPLPIASQNALLPWSAPLLLQRPPSNPVPNFYSLEDFDDEPHVESSSSPAPPKKKVIRLKQKRQRMKMVHEYRKIPAVDQMCKMLEDYDFDRTDLFPLGLEPSDDEGVSDTEPTMQWPSVSERRPNECRSSGAIEVYLLKKQLRLDRHTLLRQAQLNAPVMHASKKYSNSSGAALADRAARSRPRPPRPPNRSTRCCYVLSENGGPPSGCMERALPFSNHCAQHVLYNINQRLFSYCSESCCGQPVLCADSIITSGMCWGHYEMSQREASVGDPETEMVASTSSAQQTPQPSSIPPITFLQPAAPVHHQQDSRTMLHPHQGYNHPSATLMTDRDNRCCSPTYGGHDMSADMSRVVGVVPTADFSETEGLGTETDVSLASVAKELGFDGRELSDMLEGLPFAAADDDESGDILRDHFAVGLKEEEGVVVPGEMNDLGHSWADVEQFLLSEGYPVLTPPPFAADSSPYSATAAALPHSSSTSMASPFMAPCQSPQSAPATVCGGGSGIGGGLRPHTAIPAADSLLPHRS